MRAAAITYHTNGYISNAFKQFMKNIFSLSNFITHNTYNGLVFIQFNSSLNEIIRELEVFGTVELDKDQAIVSIVGNEIGQTEFILHKLFESIADIPVRMVSYGGSPHNVSLLVPAAYKTQTLQVLNKGIFGLD